MIIEDYVDTGLSRRDLEPLKKELNELKSIIDSPKIISTKEYEDLKEALKYYRQEYIRQSSYYYDSFSIPEDSEDKDIEDKTNIKGDNVSLLTEYILTISEQYFGQILTISSEIYNILSRGKNVFKTRKYKDDLRTAILDCSSKNHHFSRLCVVLDRNLEPNTFYREKVTTNNPYLSTIYKYKINLKDFPEFVSNELIDNEK